MAPNPAAFLGAHVPRPRHVAGISPNRPTFAHKRSTSQTEAATKFMPCASRQMSTKGRQPRVDPGRPHHITHYKYDRPIRLGPQIVRLRPAPHCRTGDPSYSLKIDAHKATSSTGSRTPTAIGSRGWFPRKDHGVPRRGRPCADMAIFNPFDFFVEPYAEEFPFTYDADLAPNSGPISRSSRPDRSSKTLRGLDFAAKTPHDRFPGRPQPAPAARDQLCDPHGARRTDAGRDADAGLGLLPRFRLAAGADRCAISVSPRVSSPAI